MAPFSAITGTNSGTKARDSDYSMSESGRRKVEAFRRVSDAVGRSIDVPGIGQVAVLPAGQRLIVAYGHEHARSGGEAGFSIGLPKRLPTVDFVVLLLGHDDLVVPTRIFLQHWDDGSRSGDSRPTPIFRRRARGREFYVLFGRNGPAEDLTPYVDAYEQLA